MKHRKFCHWLFSILLLFATSSMVWADDFHVSTKGDDSADGSVGRPWKTIQFAIDKASAGDTVHIHEGTYRESLSFNKSGNAKTGNAKTGAITISNFKNERAVLDGSNNDDVSPMIEINNQSFINVQGLVIGNLKTDKLNETPVGIMVSGACREIKIENCKIHNIASVAKLNKRLKGRNAHGIAVYGNGMSSISGLGIVGNELSDLTLGSSEAIVVNGNVDGFEIFGNIVHDCDNIGIDCIGFEGTAAKGGIDQARNGIVAENHVYNIATAKNPSYDGGSAAAGIYVDGGRDIVIERNRVHDCDFGVEVASEHKGKVTSGIVVRNNVIFNNLLAGLIMGGYNKKNTGDAENCLVINNTFFNNDTRTTGDEWGQICLQYRVSNCVFANNILQHETSKDGSNIFIVQWNKTGKNNKFDHNQYFGSADPVWVLGDEWIDQWSDFQKHEWTGDKEAFGDPKLVSPAKKDWSLGKGSPCLDSGNADAKIGDKDFAGNKRKQGDVVDRGAVETIVK